MYVTDSFVNFFKLHVLSFSNLSDMTDRALSIGVFVNKDTTSWDAKILSSCMRIVDIESDSV